MTVTADPIIDKMIIHEVSREKDGGPFTVFKRPNLNNISGVGKKLTSDLTNLFKAATLNIGEFALNGDTNAKPSFEIQLEYLDNGKKSFEECTRDLIDIFEKIIINRKLHNVKGGLLVFYTYTASAKNWLAVAVVERTSGINTDENLNLLLTQIIDLDKLHLGAAINLTDWKGSTNKRYIRFKAGTASQVRDYFEEFIGCQRDKEAAIRETAGLRNSIKEFANNNFFSDDEIQEKLNKASQYILDSFKSGKEIKLSHIANHIFPDLAEPFRTYANSNNLSEDIAIDKKELRKYTRISGKSKSINISFDRELLGSKIKYENEKLIIAKENLPDNLIKEILEEEQVRNSNLINV